MRWLISILFVAFLMTTDLLYAQDSTMEIEATLSLLDESNVYAADNATPEALAEALLEVITGAKGEKIDTMRMANLFLPDARMGLVREKDGKSKIQQFAAAGFITRSPKMYETIDFYETQIGITVNEFGNIAQVFQAYKTKGAKDAQGINSYQLMRENGEWRIISLIFQDETNTLTIPKKFLD